MRRVTTFLIRIVPLVLAACLLVACASSSPRLWPARPGEKTVRVTVYATGFHSMLALPAAKGWEEWAYGEKIWFYDDKKAAGPAEKEPDLGFRLGGAMRALFHPGPGVIEVCRAVKPYPEREPQEHLRTWQIELGESGYRRMQAFLAQSRASEKPIDQGEGQIFYLAAQRYCLFNTCHHYVAQALRAGGVPIHCSYCIIPQGFWAQLNSFAVKKS